jgi:hypothetical protein
MDGYKMYESCNLYPELCNGHKITIIHLCFEFYSSRKLGLPCIFSFRYNYI